MKWLLALAAFIGAVVAQECLNVALTEIPSCAQNCFLTGAPSIGCGGTDFACQCEKEAALYAAIEGCVATGCPQASVQVVIDGASSVCDCATGGGGSSATTQGSSFASTKSNTPATTATSAASAASATTGGSSIASYTYTTRPALTPTATAGAAPTARAAMGVVGGVVAAVALL
ncbi:hypothetical protein BJ170DRAFT_679469 [Xylariales sp. AK1849]|nr:hypothetical protein BJ170DRAFT_679469 [Xylariales sp. AK1849]